MRKRKTICLITSFPETMHAKRISKGVFTQCEKYGYNVAQFASMVNLDFYFKNYAVGERRIYDIIEPSRFDGIILDNISLLHNNQSELVDLLYEWICKQSSVPVACIGIPYKDLPAVDGKNEDMFRELCRHAIDEHGCKRICILTGMQGNHEAEQRLQFMVDEITLHGLSVPPEYRVYGDFWYTSGEKLAHDIVEGRIEKPDAVIAASDHMALGLIQELTKLGKKVPEYLCVLGFEATDEGALEDISLTSIESNFASAAADAVDLIRQQADPGEPILPYKADTKSMLHIGMSCGCPPDIKRTMDTVKSSLYYTERNYTSDVFEDNIDIGLLMENYIPEQLTSSADPQDCLTRIYHSLYVVSPYENFYLCLRDDWLDPEADLTDAKPDKMSIAVLKSNTGKEDIITDADKITFDSSLMLPQMFDRSDTPSAYYFSAVHFSNKTLGYAVLQRKLSHHQKYNLVYRNFIRFINNALEMARTKNRFVVMSSHDKMTGLLNRRGMYQELDKLTPGIAEGDELFVCVIDMDGLKYINDTFGHTEGDYGITRVSEAALSICKGGDICARAGGDEFYIVGTRAAGGFDAEKTTSRFCERLAALTENDGKPFPVTASIGCAVGSKNDDFEALLSEADENMYRFKLKRKRQRQG